MLRYLKSWIDQLRRGRLKPFEKLAGTLLDHLEGLLNSCRIKVALGVVEAASGNIKALLRRGRGYQNLGYLLLKPNAWPPLRPNSSPFEGQPKMRSRPNSCTGPYLHVQLICIQRARSDSFLIDSY